MPPMLHVAFNELPSRRAKQLRASHVASCDAQGQDVLKLISETVCSAQLIEGGPRPHAARKRLIQEPSVQQNIHSRLGCGDLHSAEDIIPATLDLDQDRIQVS